MKLKICGINDAAFAAEAARRGVDYLGFIFEPSSPRYVTVEKAALIAAADWGQSALPGSTPNTQTTQTPKQPKHPLLVGVFVRHSVAEIIAIMRAARLDVVQLHRRADAADVAALRAAGYEVWTLAGGAEGDGVLFDSSHGDGETAFRRGAYRAILAGRIGVDNLAAALALGPDVLDVNSSLETAPGVKSAERLVQFLDALSNHTQKNSKS